MSIISITTTKDIYILMYCFQNSSYWYLRQAWQPKGNCPWVTSLKRYSGEHSNAKRAACCGLGVSFQFTGLASLRIKETDRIEALKKELHKLGFYIKSANASELFWDGVQHTPTGEAIDTYEDHRMAMAFAPLAIKFPHLKINNPQVVTKSYPDYWTDLQKAKFSVSGLEENK